MRSVLRFDDQRSRSCTSTLLTISYFVGLTIAAENQSSSNLVAAVTLQSPGELKNTYPGYFAVFSALPPPTGDFFAWLVPGDGLGCQALQPAPSVGRPVVAIVRRGVCTFVEKAQHAEAAGAVGVIVVSDGEEIWPMQGGGNFTDEALAVNIFALMMQNSTGELITNWMRLHPSASVTMSVEVYSVSKWVQLVSFAIIILMATFLVVAGAFFATADLRVGSPLAPKPHTEEVVEIDNATAAGFCVMGSLMLVLLFFLMRYLIYVIIFCFCVGGFSCVWQIGSMALSYNFPALKRTLCNIPNVGKVSQAEGIAALPAVALIVSWLVFRNTPYGWIFQDIIGAGFLCWIQRTLRLPNIQVATILLTAMFFFDIFWVFISPLFFQKSVMVEVAKGGGTGEKVPMLLRVPSIGDMLGGERMLGFGDIALPGLLISYLRRHDIIGLRGACNGYFVPAVIGYFIGLCCTIVALAIMQLGQPALLYLVPGTLGTTYVLGCCRGEISELWNGKPRPRPLEEDSESGSEANSPDGL